jgi:hypothetical protein
MTNNTRTFLGRAVHAGTFAPASRLDLDAALRGAVVRAV